MNKKTIIQIVVIAGAFLASGIVLYSGFSGNNPPPLGGPAAGVAVPTAESLMPYGATFDYQKLDDLRSKNFQYGVVRYPKVDVSQDVGLNTLSDLMKPVQNNQQIPLK